MSNVFGNPITDSTLQAMSEYVGKDITAVDRARVAINMKNANSKDTNARTYVENVKQQWGNGASALCLVYNATGYTMTIVDYHDWYGHIGPAPYPIQIRNGQWGAFLHVHTSGSATGSDAAVVYRGKRGDEGELCDYMMAWSNPWGRAASDNSVCAETRDAGHYGTSQWGDVYKTLTDETRYYRFDLWNGCLSIVSTGSATSPVLEALFTLEAAANPDNA